MSCSEIEKARKRAWYNTPKNKAKERTYYLARKEEIRAHSREHYQSHKEKYAAASRVWRQANKEKIKAAKRAEYLANKTKRATQGKARYQENKERAHQQKVATYAANKEREITAARRWALDHPEHARSLKQTHKARKRKAFVETVSPAVVFARDKGVCGICGLAVDPSDWHLDHAIPLSKGGEHSYANVQVSHPKCNLSKGAKLPAELG